MLNSTILIKVKQRLNKLDSQDYIHVEAWQILEAFNKAQVDWCRRNLHGTNSTKEGDEQSNRRIDDLQPLLRELSLTGAETDDYFQSNNFPVDEVKAMGADVIIGVDIQSGLEEKKELDSAVKILNQIVGFQMYKTLDYHQIRNCHVFFVFI